jgi:uncharacterized protein (TIGR02145 family)
VSGRLPDLKDSYVSSFASNSAVIGYNITPDNENPVTARGIFWSTDEQTILSGNKTDDGTDEGSYFSLIKGLAPGTKYFAKAYVINDEGTVYGSTLSFTTLNLISDNEGNEYSIVNIGSQTWMQENLRAKKYQNGDPIPRVILPADWRILTSDAYCLYNDDEESDTEYGNIYNWYSVADGRKICPTGWHVPSENEWATLESNLGESSLAAGKLKEAGTGHWEVYNIGATNSSGFTALPGGCCTDWGYSCGRNSGAWFWSTTSVNQDSAYLLYLSMYSSRAYNYTWSKIYGFSVRCIKN